MVRHSYFWQQEGLGGCQHVQLFTHLLSPLLLTASGPYAHLAWADAKPLLGAVPPYLKASRPL